LIHGPTEKCQQCFGPKYSHFEHSTPHTAEAYISFLEITQEILKAILAWWTTWSGYWFLLSTGGVTEIG
jgi:hypothetical protein